MAPKKSTVNEWAVKRAVNKVLESYPESYWFMPVPYGYGKSSLDYLICHYGVFIGIETKAPGEVPTARQRLIMKQIEDAGGEAFVIDSVDQSHLLRAYLEQVKQDATSTSQPQAQASRSALRGEYPKLVSSGAAPVGRRRAAHPAAASADRDLSSAEDGVRRTKSYLDALRLERRQTVRESKKHFSDADIRAASLRPEWDGDRED